MDGKMPFGYRVLGQAMGRLEAQVLGQSKHQVITSALHRSSSRFWDGILDANSEAIPVVAPRTFYVTSQTGPSKHPLLQRTTAWYLNAYYGPNDGLVSLEDQSLPELGTVLAVLDAGHTDLTRRFPSGRLKKRLRWALVDAVIMAVGSGPGPVAKRDANLARTSRPTGQVTLTGAASCPLNGGLEPRDHVGTPASMRRTGGATRHVRRSASLREWTLY